MNIQKLKEIVLSTDKIFFDETLRNDVTVKGDSDFVTKADVSISNYLRAELAREFPEVGFVSEEEEISEQKGAYWILDPIDGTTNFMHDMKLSCVSLGLCENGVITAGIIYIPYSGELFHAEKGKGAYLCDKPIRVSEHSSLSDCIGCYEYNAYFKNEVNEALECAKKIYLSCQDVRTLGSAAIQLAFIACGRADVFLGRYLKPWDYAAATVLIEEAGGKISHTNGDIQFTELNRHVIATNKNVFESFKNLF